MTQLVKIEPVIVEMENKPEMALALENLKIKHFEEAERNTKTKDLITRLLALLDVKIKDDKDEKRQNEQNTIVHAFINEKLKQFTYEEIKCAFKMFVAGELVENSKPMLALQQLNAVVVGRVLRAYEEQKNRSLVEYFKQRELMIAPPEVKKSDEQIKEDIKQGMWDAWNEFKATGDLYSGHVWVVKRLFKLGVIKLTDQEVDDYKAKAKTLVIAKKSQEKKVKEGEFLPMDTYVKRLEKDDDPIKLEARRLTLVDYFRGITEEEFKKVIG